MTKTETIVQSTEEIMQDTEEEVQLTVSEDVPDIEIMDAIGEETVEQTSTDEEQDVEISLTDSDIAIPKIQGLADLKEGFLEVDMGSTIDEMYTVITNMEDQLKNVLKINAILEKDLDKSKVRIEYLRKQETLLKQKIGQLQKEMPSKRELAIELDHLISERNDDQIAINSMKKRISDLKEEVNRYQSQLEKISEEKNDLLSDVDYMNATIDESTKKMNGYKMNIQSLKGECIANVKKIKDLEGQLKQSAAEKDALQHKLDESRRTISDLHSAWQQDRKSRQK